jgi:hypothetical protein
MVRRTVAGFMTVVLIPAALAAQTTTLTIETMSADVYESRAAAARVIGLAPRGRVLQVAREDGDWATVLWPEAKAGIGYVRLRIGSLAKADSEEPSSVSDAQADVDAVEQAVVIIWEARSRSTTTPHDQPAQ